MTDMQNCKPTFYFKLPCSAVNMKLKGSVVLLHSVLSVLSVKLKVKTTQYLILNKEVITLQPIRGSNPVKSGL